MSDFSRTRSFGLDAARASAIMFVLLSHARQMLVHPQDGLIMTFGGGFGVELFFALSGYLIGTILLKLFDRGATASSLGKFWFRRWMRTIPAYMIVLLFIYLTSGRFSPEYLVFLQGPLLGNFSILPVSWSLAVEEWFYLLFPPLCLLCVFFNRRNGFLMAAFLLLLLPTAFRVAQFWLGGSLMHFSGDVRANTFRFDTLALGVLFAYAMHRPNFRRWFFSHRSVVSGAATVTFAIALILHLSRFTPWPIMLPGWFAIIFMLSFYGVTCCLIVGASVFIERPPNAVMGNVVSYISRVSYSAYLWHLILLEWMVHAFPHERGVVLYVVFVVLTLVLAGVLYTLTEVPFLAFRDKVFPSGGRGTPPPASVRGEPQSAPAALL